MRFLLVLLSYLFNLYLVAASQESKALRASSPTPTLEQRADPETIIVVTVTASPSALPSSSSYTNPAKFKYDVLNQTNYYRHQHNASDLSWNDTLATYAQQWADLCNWKHSDGPYGENLAEGFANVTAAVDAWGIESKKYDYSKPTGFTEQTGHFTQLVWKDTTDVGCGVTNCPANDDDSGDEKAVGWYLVCEYWPPGNVVGDNNAYFKENVDPSISGAHTLVKDGNLSVCMIMTFGVILFHWL